MKKSAKKPTPKSTPKMPRHLLTGWIVFDATYQREYEIDFVVDGVAFVTLPEYAKGGSYHHAIALDEMQTGDGELFKLFASRKAFEAFQAIYYPKANP